MIYYGSSYLLADRPTLSSYTGLGPHTPEKVSEVSLPYHSVHVTNSKDVELTEDDTVYIDRWGRVTGFTIGDACYVIGES